MTKNIFVGKFNKNKVDVQHKKGYLPFLIQARTFKINFQTFYFSLKILPMLKIIMKS
jgi:hypothetical protein